MNATLTSPTAAQLRAWSALWAKLLAPPPEEHEKAGGAPPAPPAFEDGV